MSLRARAVGCAVAAFASWARCEAPGALPAWPEELGAPTAADRERAPAAVRELPALEGRFRRALLDLAPLEGRNVARARKELTELAAGAATDRWVQAARYTLAWLEEIEGSVEAARNAYRGLVLDDPRSAAGRRAGTAFGRLELRRDQPAEAALWLQAVVERGGAPTAVELREAALRGVLRTQAAAALRPTAAARSSATELREATLLARTAAGDVIAADRKRGLVVRFANAERPVQTWPLAAVTALAVDPFGRIFAAAASTILRLDGDTPIVVARTGSFGTVSALAVDAAGRLWIADRRGDRVGLAHADGSDPDVVGEKRPERVSALAWDGRNVVALEPSAGRIVALGIDGTERVILAGLAETPIAMAANGAGTVAVLDAAGGILVVSSTGKIEERLDPAALGVARPLAVALGLDGAIDGFDGADGRVVRLR